MEDGRCLLDVINDESALTDFLTKEIPAFANASNGGPIVLNRSPSPLVQNAKVTIQPTRVQVSATSQATGPAVCSQTTYFTTTRPQVVTPVIFPGAMSLPSNKNVNHTPNIQLNVNQQTVQQNVNHQSVHQTVSRQNTVQISKVQNVTHQNMSHQNVNHQSAVQVSNLNVRSPMGVRTPVKILPQQTTGVVDRQGSPSLTPINTVNVNAQVLGQQNLTFLPKTGNSNNVNILANVPGIAQPVALQGTVIQTSTGSKILIQGNQFGGQTLNLTSSPQIAIRPQTSNTVVSAASTVQTLPQIAIKPQPNVNVNPVNLQTVTAGQPTVRLANFGSPQQQVVVQRGVSPDLFVRTVAVNPVQYQGVSTTGNQSNIQQPSSGVTVQSVPRQPLVNNVPQQQPPPVQVPTPVNAAAAAPANQGSITLSIPQGVNLQSLQGLNLEELKKIPGVSVISNKRPVQPKPLIKPAAPVTVVTTTVSVASSNITSWSPQRVVNTDGGVTASLPAGVPSVVNGNANIPDVTSTTGSNKPLLITSQPQPQQLLQQQQQQNSQQQQQQVLQKIQLQLKQLNALPNPGPEQTNLIQQLLTIRQKILTKAATPGSIVVKSEPQQSVPNPPNQQQTAGDILTMLLGNPDVGAAMASQSGGSTTQAAGASNQPPLLTQIKVGNQTISINLTSQQREKIQSQLGKLSPEQQQLFYKHQQALILKFHQQKQQKQALAQQGQKPPTVVQPGILTKPQSIISQPKVVTVIGSSGSTLRKPPEMPRMKLLPNMPMNRSAIIVRQLGKDQENVVTADCTTPFRSRQESLKRLLRYHIYQQKDYPEEVLKKAEDDYEEICTDLVEKKNKLFDRYRKLLWDDSRRDVPSPEMVLVHRLLHSDIKNKLEQEKKSPPENPEDLLNTSADMSSQPASQSEQEMLNSESEIDVTSETCTQEPNPEPSPSSQKIGDKSNSDIDVCSSPRLLVKIKRCGAPLETTDEEESYVSESKRTKHSDKVESLKLKLKLGKPEVSPSHIPKLKISLRKEESNSPPDLIDPLTGLVESDSRYSERTSNLSESLDETKQYYEEDDSMLSQDDTSNNDSSMTTDVLKQPVYSDISDAEDISDDDNTSDNTDVGTTESPRSLKTANHSLKTGNDLVSYDSYSFQSEDSGRNSTSLPQPDLMDYDSRESVGFTQPGGANPQDPLGLNSLQSEDQDQTWSVPFTDSSQNANDIPDEPEEVQSAIQSILGLQGDPLQDDLDAAVQSILM